MYRSSEWRIDYHDDKALSQTSVYRPGLGLATPLEKAVLTGSATAVTRRDNLRLSIILFELEYTNRLIPVNNV